MRADDLDLGELLKFERKGGVLSFGGERALLFDALALGILRKEIIEWLGLSGARGILTRFGYALGRRTAEALRDAFPWDDEAEWKAAGPRFIALRGLVFSESVLRAPSEPLTRPFVESTWHESYEAEQHVLQLGQANEPVCWTLCGFATGYLSYCNGRDIYCMEDRCRGKGDALCHLVGRPREEWGNEIEAHLPFYQTQCLDDALAALTKEIKRVEQRLRARRPALARTEKGDFDLRGIVAQSSAMLRVLDLAQRVAKVDSTVLVTGESGSGKERIARLIHDESTRATGPFVAINCGAVPESLLESELFGHAKGAFTGATQDRPGLFEAANGGTLFLDEIGEVPPVMQVKLLRTLQEREIRRVGENKNRRVNVRIVAATNRDLVVEVGAARFRQDLYYRLRVVELRVPPLRERREDILSLARMFVAETTARAGRKVSGLTPGAANQLVRYHWPGNVRELENAIERAVALARGSRIDVDDLPEEIGQTLPSGYVPGDMRSLAHVERDYILAVLKATGGNRAKAAEQLEIGEATLYRRLKEYEVSGARGET